jgi:Tfp pilus assembly protein PilO
MSQSYVFYNRISMVLILACIVVGYFFTFAQWNTVSENQAAISVLAVENDKLKQAQNALDTFLQYYKTHQEDVATASTALPLKSDDMPNFINIVSNLAAQSGITLTNFRINYLPVPAGSENTIQPIQISMVANGSFASFKDLIIRFESSRRLIDIDHITARPAVAAGTQLTYQITLKTYYQK